MSNSIAPVRVTVWGENVHEQRDEDVRRLYPDGMHSEIAAAITEHLGDQVVVTTATLQDPEHGLSADALEATDVLTWWGHAAHHDVDDEVVERVRRRVLSGMGLLVLHSAHASKIFIRLMGTTCTLNWRNDNDRELVWAVAPTHPVADGVPNPIIIQAHEMYGEYFDIPAPDELVFISSFSGGEVFRSGCGYHRGHGRIFYFSPGDQEYPVYHHPDVRRVIANAVSWVAPRMRELSEPLSARRPNGWYESRDPRLRAGR